MSKFHITGRGEPGPCRATVGACPLGGEGEHYSSKEEAWAAYEDKMQEQTFASMTKASNTANYDDDPFDPDGYYNESNEEYERRLARERKTLVADPRLQAFVPRDGQYNKYYADTDKKHFEDKEGPGSKFEDPTLTKLEDVVALTIQQRRNLKGDDRERLVAMGAKPEAMKEGFRYLLVKTKGSVGAAPLDSFPPRHHLQSSPHQRRR